MVIATVETIEAQVKRELANLERRWEVINAYHDGVITEAEMDEVLMTLPLEKSFYHRMAKYWPEVELDEILSLEGGDEREQ